MIRYPKCKLELDSLAPIGFVYDECGMLRRLPKNMVRWKYKYNKEYWENEEKLGRAVKRGVSVSC